MHYAVNRHDGGVSIVHLVDDKANIQAFMGKWPPGMQAEHDFASARKIDPADVPKDRTFRDAWGHDLRVDIPRARDIIRQKMRVMRAAILAEMDVGYQRADEAGDTKAKAEIAAKKTAWRDITKHPSIEKANTPDALKALLLPEALPPRA